VFARFNLEEFEIAMLSNLVPQSPDEAKVLIPSLSRIEDDQVLQEII
jgi:hypothetical protein